jgi:hypothetical protein
MSRLADLQYYHLGQGEKEALTLTAHVAEDAVFVTMTFSPWWSRSAWACRPPCFSILSLDEHDEGNSV